MKAHVVVNEAVGEFRRKPDHAAEQVSQAVLGSPLRVLGQRGRGQWLRVQGPDDYRGWIRSWSVHPMTAAELKLYRSGPGVEVDALVARIREKATNRSPVVREAPVGCRLRRLGRSGSWIRLLLPDGERGYLHARDLLVDPRTLRSTHRPHDLPSLLRTAQRFLGIPYQWGGITAKGLDCSGLVQTVFGMYGVALPRDSKDQFRLVKRETYIDRSPDEAHHGNLIFFGESDGAISHVGIGLDEGRFLHARGRVRINSLRPQDQGFDRDLFRMFRGAGPVLLQ